jgi:hypothetical protein
MKTPEQARDEIHGVVTYRVLGPCTCSSDYTERKLIAPDCLWHHYHDEMEEALEEAYQRGRKGQ